MVSVSSQVKILNVDDHEISRYTKSRILRRAGFQVSEATTGNEALRLVAEERPDLVLLDVRLPDISGIEVCQRIKTDPRLASTLVLQISASFVRGTDRARGLEQGADAYLAEPVEPEELIANVKALLRLRQAEEILREQAERIHLAFDTATMAAWDWDLLTGQVTWSGHHERLLGLAPGTFGGAYQEFLASVYPEDRERIDQVITHSLATRTAYTEQFRVLWPDGSLHWLRGQGQILSNATGQAIRLIGVIQDITEFKRAEQVQRLLAETNSLLVSSLDYEATLQSMTYLVVPTLADLCIVDILETDGSVQRLAMISSNSTKKALVGELGRSYPANPQGCGPIAQVIRDRQPLLLPEITDEIRLAAARDAHHLELIRQLNMQSGLFVPLIARDQLFGVLTLAMTESGRRYNEEDLALAEELARRAALAVDNARLYRQAQTLNAELEQRVTRRTAELQTTNTKLENEMVERQRMQAELTEMQRRLAEGLEADRLQLAQELHDGPVQLLYGVAYSLSSLAQAVTGEANEAQFSKARELLQQVVRELRTMASELRPPTLAPFGLEKAITSHADQFQQAHPELTIKLTLIPDQQLLPERVRLALFRIYQQALNNIVQHAQANQVFVRFTFNTKQVALEIQDDGQGFEVPQRWIELARQGHLGLVGMSERAEVIGGRLEVISAPGAGTTIRATVPCDTR